MIRDSIYTDPDAIEQLYLSPDNEMLLEEGGTGIPINQNANSNFGDLVVPITDVFDGVQPLANDKFPEAFLE